jgi:hypothetical protein
MGDQIEAGWEMTKYELAHALLLWGELHCQMQALEERIEQAVLEGGATVVVGNVRARYSKGRKSYDYKAIVDALEPAVAVDTVALFTTMPRIPAPVVDWRGLAKSLGLEAPFKQASPGVRVLWED